MRRYWADTTALIIVSTLGAGFVELVIAGLAPGQVLSARLLAIPVCLLTARPYGMYRDIVFIRGGGPTGGRARRLVLDTLAFMSFQIPLYVAILLYAGATPGEILRAVLGALAVMAVSGRPAGIVLEACRRAWRVA